MPTIFSAIERRRIIDAIDQLVSSRKTITELLIEQVNGKSIAENLMDALHLANIAGKKLEKFHPDAEMLPITEWRTCGVEYGILCDAEHRKLPNMSDEELTAWKKSTSKAIKKAAKLLDVAIQKVRNSLVEGAPDNDIRLVPGGFEYYGKKHRLTGKPLNMLKALLAARHHACTKDMLLEALPVEDLYVTFPEQAVKDHAKKLRAILRKAAEDAGLPCDDPLPSSGKGAQLTYALAMP